MTLGPQVVSASQELSTAPRAESTSRFMVRLRTPAGYLVCDEACRPEDLLASADADGQGAAKLTWLCGRFVGIDTLLVATALHLAKQGCLDLLAALSGPGPHLEEVEEMRELFSQIARLVQRNLEGRERSHSHTVRNGPVSSAADRAS